MKRALKIVFSIILTLAVLVSVFWYLLQYDQDFTRDMLLSWARHLDDSGNKSLSNKIYDLAYRYADNDDAIAIELARQYRERGNYTKAEFTLSKAISDGASAELYIALCMTYVEQDKLLDAVTMLDSVADPAIKQQLDEMRPTIPTANPAQGNHNTYISVTLSSPGNTVYYILGDAYPSTSGVYTAPIDLPGGQTSIRAVSVAPNGLVSPLTVLDYTVTGVIEEVAFADEAIEKAIREQLMVDDSHVIYSNELWTVDFFMVPTDAKTLEDLRKLPFLKQLGIRGGQFTDLSILSGLITLEDLSVTDFVLASSDMAAIGAMTQLKSLTLANCSISTIESLSDLTELTYLDLRSNTLRDLTVISGFTNLEYLNLSHNAVTDLTLLGGLDKLIELQLDFNSIESTAPLAQCQALASLNINHNKLTALEGLDQLPNLRSLFAAFNKLEMVDNLASNVTLGELDISNNVISDIAALHTLNQLFTLNFSYNQVSSIPAFAKDCALVMIKGSQNKISSLDPLEGLENLNIVTMDYNAGIKSLKPLETCHLLVEVSVYGTAVKDVGTLKDLNVIVKYSPI